VPPPATPPGAVPDAEAPGVEAPPGESGFAALGIPPEPAEKLARRGIHSPTEIQRLAIPPLLSGRKLIFRSATGTGKTYAYLLPALLRLYPGEKAGEAPEVPAYRGPSRRGPSLLVCAPTYELCSQIAGETEFLFDSPPALLIGSAALGRQIEGLKKKKPPLAVGNPGRLLALAKMGKLRFRDLEFLVLDEADRLVSDESFEETAALLRLIGGELRGRAFGAAACSATLSPKNRERILSLLPGAEVLESSGQEILRERIEHWAFFCEGRQKASFLRSFLAAARPRKALVFTGRGWDAGKLVADLQYHGVPARGLYGDMDKKERKSAVEAFRSGKAPVLVSSDLAARGLDIPGISHIVALDVPADGEAYIHRAGRSARAGRRGIMVSIGDETEMRRLSALEKRLGITVRPKELYRGKITAPPP
jgi:superfamily II DNA/RNA helicase